MAEVESLQELAAATGSHAAHVTRKQPKSPHEAVKM